MTDFRKEYEEKKVDAKEAAKLVQSGDWIDIGHALSIPVHLLDAIADRAEELEDVNIRGYLLFRPSPFVAANERVGRKVFTYNSWYLGGFDRKALKMAHGGVYHAPMRFAQLPLYFKKGDVPPYDTLFLQTGPMDEYGYFNLGPCIASTWASIQQARQVVLEVNPNMPYTVGAHSDTIHISQVKALVESDEPMVTIPDATPSELDRKIASVVMPEIVDGATLQLGIGGMPNAVGAMIAESDLKDLSIHTEMYVDSMMKMAKAGKITGRYNELHPGKQMFAFATGTQALYDYLDHNQTIITAPVDYVNDPSVCAQMDHFTSINNCINVDLFGQVNGESAGTRQISGTGGQLDFVLGAYLSRGGKSIIALASTHKGKDGSLVSTILPTLQEGSTVTDPRNTTQYVATEYGIVSLMGKSMWQRAEGLISIAHPDFREDLIEKAKAMGIWRNSNKR